MSDFSSIENDFVSQITAVIEKNISNEQFGVTELADEMNMSRSNLLRKVKKQTNLSVSQLISLVRLKHGMDLLQKSSLNVSEVAHQVGFSSTSYFIKCFREQYGYPPGEVGKRDATKEETKINLTKANGTSRKKKLLLASGTLLIIAALGLLIYYNITQSKKYPLEKSIAILPFKNESNDSTNIYLINGLMESTLTNLQKIKDLKVISRTSAEKYRNTAKSIPEMAKELNVNYFVEGSGQKIGDRILLNIQLIEAASDKHLWAKQYRREAKDIFQLQQEVAQNIAEEIQAIITPEEEKRIKKIPTNNLAAYDWFLKGGELAYKGGQKNLEESILYFKKAIELDPKFALAFAELAIIYYYLDIFHTEKKYLAEINNNADKALLYDSKLAESLVAKAMFYMEKKEYESAVPHLEKALEYNPNSPLVIHFLADLYNLYIPNAPKYLEYALKGLRIDVASYDSVTTSYTYLHLSNAFVQTGFREEALKYINKSLDYNSKNPFGYIKTFILYAKSGDLKQTKALLIKELNRDTTRVDIILQIGHTCYTMRDYEGSYKYLKRFIEITESQHLDIFKNDYLMIGVILSKIGLKEKSAEFIKTFKDYADNDRTIYKHANLAMYYLNQGESAKAIEHLKLFSKEDNYQYWVLLLEKEPMVDPIRDLPEFIKVMNDIKTKFWNTHKKIRASLEEKGLL